jgi:hypothetical protein
MSDVQVIELLVRRLLAGDRRVAGVLRYAARKGRAALVGRARLALLRRGLTLDSCARTLSDRARECYVWGSRERGIWCATRAGLLARRARRYHEAAAFLGEIGGL